MLETSSNLEIPYVMPAQAQKHVTVNEAFRMIDAAVQINLIKPQANELPSQPEAGDCYQVIDPAPELWADNIGNVAVWVDDAWMFLKPKIGWIARDDETGNLLIHDGTSWTEVNNEVPDQLLINQIGVNMASDENSRMAVSSPGSTFSHAGDDHRLKINKSTANDTASLIFQNAWSGRAEIGIVGDDQLGFRVSPDGVNWNETMVFDQLGGYVGIGVHAPTSRLDVKSNSAGEEIFRMRASIGNSNLKVSENSSSNLYLQAKDSNGNLTIQFHTAGKSYLTGDLAVGGNSPTVRLDVDGPVRTRELTVAALPSANSAGSGTIAFVTDHNQGPALAVSDGNAWRFIAL